VTLWLVTAWVVVAAAQEWVPCDLAPGSGEGDAECAVVPLPLDPAAPEGPTYDVAVKRAPAPVQPARGQLWFVTGGPGDAGTDDIGVMASFEDLGADLDRYTFDARGTGRSGRFGCPDQEHPASFDGFEVVGEEWGPCMAHVAAAYGDVLPYVTTSTTAHDLVALTERFAGDGDAIYWWGLSYGTFLVQRALHIAPDLPDGVLLDGLVPADWGFHEFDAGLDAVTRDFLEECADDEECSKRMGGDPVRFVEDTLDVLDDSRCAALGIDVPTAKLLSGALLMSGERYAAMVPAVWIRLERCAPRDRRAFVHLFGTLFPEGGGGLSEKPGHSPVAQRHIAYADLWDPAADPAALEAALDDTIATTEVSANFAAIYAEWPVVPPPDPLDGLFPTTDVPILAMHGGFDPTMPVSRLDGFEQWLDGPAQQVVIAPRANHVTLNFGACPAGIQADFLADPTAPLDTSCLDDMPRFDFRGDPDENRAVWGTADGWGDGLACATTRPTPSWLVLLLVPLVRRRAR